MSLFICVCQKPFTLISLSPSYFLEQDNAKSIINVLTNDRLSILDSNYKIGQNLDNESKNSENQ